MIICNELESGKITERLGEIRGEIRGRLGGHHTKLWGLLSRKSRPDVFSKAAENLSFRSDDLVRCPSNCP